jgi:hypothetical protein
MVCSLAAETMEDQYLAMVKRHVNGKAGERGVDLMGRMFGELVLAMDCNPDDIRRMRSGWRCSAAWQRAVGQEHAERAAGGIGQAGGPRDRRGQAQASADAQATGNVRVAVVLIDRASRDTSQVGQGRAAWRASACRTGADYVSWLAPSGRSDRSAQRQ